MKTKDPLHPTLYKACHKDPRGSISDCGKLRTEPYSYLFLPPLSRLKIFLGIKIIGIRRQYLHNFRGMEFIKKIIIKGPRAEGEKEF